MRRLLAGVSAIALALAACQLFADIHSEHGDPPFDAGQPKDPCTKVQPPDPPPAGDTTPDIAPMFFAVRNFKIAPQGETLGYDLDDHCTGDSTSTTKASSCVGTTQVNDDDGGVDNSFGHALEKVAIPSSGSGDDPVGATLTSNVASGTATVLFQLTNYNGTANDNDVTVAIINGGRNQDNVCGDAAVPDAGWNLDPFDAGDFGPNKFPPQWDGCDAWYFSSSAAVVTGVATLGVTGYVVNGELVAKDATNQLYTLGLNGATIALQRPVLTATIQRDDGGRLTLQNGIVAGAAPLDSVYQFVGHAMLAKMLVCDIPGIIGQAVTTLCAAQDIRLDRDSSAPCDAISFTIGFEAEPARLANPFDGRVTLCDAGPLSACSP